MHIIGSDMHNMTSRPPKMEEAAIKIKKKFGTEFFSSLENNAVKIFNNERIK
ncbi:MAG: CpsB/CapC family capsule biosynthesis tyrosine phosphatase [Clostridia bacterium]|nr:CpsB/CapC family capsule biosynthesis tyrosine phosphatase [Clostridia bacterium]